MSSSSSVDFPSPSLSVTDFNAGRAPRAGGNATHPVAQEQKFGAQREWELKKQTLGRMFGLHVPQQMMMERNIVGRGAARLPGMPSSNLGLDILTNNLESLDWSDVYNDPTCAEEAGDWRSSMEEKMGLTSKLPAST